MKEPFQFTGEWEFKIQLEGLKNYQSRMGSYTGKSHSETPKGIVKMIIQDELDDSIEPSIEQITAINFLLVNQTEILQEMDNVLWQNWEGIKTNYDLHDVEDFPFAKDIHTKEDLKRIYGVGNIFIHLGHRDRIAYYGFECGCEWDEEHGIGFLMHKTKVIKFGGAELGFVSTKGLKEDGTYEPVKPQEKTTIIPKRYPPHPIFNTYKPSHAEANRDYGHQLIIYKVNDKFFNLIEEGHDINYTFQGSPNRNSYLSSACIWGNDEVFDFLLEKGADTKWVIHDAILKGRKDFVEKLISKGVDINEKDRFGKSILENRLTGHLNYFSNNITAEQREQTVKRSQKQIDYYKEQGQELSKKRLDAMLKLPLEKINDNRKFIHWLLEKDASIEDETVQKLLKNFSQKEQFAEIEKELYSLLGKSK